MQSNFAEDVQGVRVVRWNPEHPGGGRVDNFGDLLGPLVVRRVVGERTAAHSGPSLLTIGSILQFAERGDVVWGSGINGKLRAGRIDPRRALDVRAVRGPLTAAALEATGVGVPTTSGDPALLLPSVFPESRALAAPDRRRHPVVVVPNVNDHDLDAAGYHVVSPIGDPWRVIGEVLTGALVVGSSLHAIITAEAYGLPARAVRSASESIIKYVDYYEGTGRRGVRIAESVEQAVALGGVEPAPVFDSAALTDAFPEDLWTGRRTAREPLGPRRLDAVVADVTARAVDGDPGWQELARRLVVPVLRERAAVLDDQQLDTVAAAVRRLDEHGLLDSTDPRWARTRTLADLRLGPDLRRAALLNDRGHQATLDTVERAGADGVLRLGGTLQLPDGRPRELDVVLSSADDDLGARVAVDSVLDEVQPTTGTARWSVGLPVADLREGTTVLVFTISVAGVAHDVVVGSAPPVAFPRWWSDGIPYRVDRTGRGKVVLHKGTGDR